MDQTENKCQFNFKDISGNQLKLCIEEVSHCLKISILNSRKGLYRKCILIFIIASVDILLLTFNVVSLNVILAIFCFVLAYMYTVCNITIEENLVIVEDVGIEVVKIQVMGVKKKFFPLEQVQKCFINEVIFRNKVLFVLTLLINDIKNHDKLVPLFTDTMPKLELLKMVYNYIKHKL